MAAISPLLSNIYLHKLDEFVEREMIPQHTRGSSRKRNRDYLRLAKRLQGARRRGDRAAARELALQMRSVPYGDPMDPGYRRLKYIRYADLCRGRHKSAYAEVRVMPTLAMDVLVRAVSSCLVSA
jgi:hypothetical protein